MQSLCSCPGMTTRRLFVRATYSGGGAPTPGDFPVTQYGKWDLSAFHLLPQDAHTGAVCTATSSGLPVCSGKTVWAINFTPSWVPSVRYSDPPFFQRTIMHLSPWCLTALTLCVWKKIKLSPFPLCPFLMMISHSFKKQSNCFSTIHSSVVQVPD